MRFVIREAIFYVFWAVFFGVAAWAAIQFAPVTLLREHYRIHMEQETHLRQMLRDAGAHTEEQ